MSILPIEYLYSQWPVGFVISNSCNRLVVFAVKGRSHDAIATAIFSSQLMGLYGIRCKCSHGVIVTRTSQLASQ